jgi:hypothetical protein
MAPNPPNDPVPPMSPAERDAYEAWLDEIVGLQEAGKLRGKVHPDTLGRDPATRAKILHLSARRRGMRRRHALMLDD